MMKKLQRFIAYILCMALVLANGMPVTALSEGIEQPETVESVMVVEETIAAEPPAAEPIVEEPAVEEVIVEEQYSTNPNQTPSQCLSK